MVRYKLSGIGEAKRKGVGKAEKIMSIPKRQAGDLPTMNPRFRMRESRYVYSVLNRGLSTFFDGLSKVDMKTGEVRYWDNPKGHTPGEAIFVPNPEGEEEDDGVLLSVVLDGFRKTSYLVCLDARTMAELGRADVQCVVGFGFHGAHVG
jgi:torulene dioxygenase